MDSRFVVSSYKSLLRLFSFAHERFELCSCLRECDSLYRDLKSQLSDLDLPFAQFSVWEDVLYDMYLKSTVIFQEGS